MPLTSGSDPATPPFTQSQLRMEPDARANQILDVVAAHFVRHGVASASVSAIARDAGVTRSLIYHYFPSKNALLEGLWRREARSLLEATRPDPALSRRDNLRKALSSYLGHISAAGEDVRQLYNPEGIALPASELVENNHRQQETWIIQMLGMDDSTHNRLVIGGWLVFVQHIVRGTVAMNDGQKLADIEDLCIRALEGALNRKL